MSWLKHDASLRLCRGLQDMNLNPTQIIVIGAAVVFGLPIAAGLTAAHFLGAVNGLIVGVVVFALILTIAQRKLRKSKGE